MAALHANSTSAILATLTATTNETLVATAYRARLLHLFSHL